MAGAAFGEVHVPTTKPKKTTDQKLLVLVPFWGLFGVLKTKGLSVGTIARWILCESSIKF